MYVYILTTQTQTVLYIGITNDLTRRLYEYSNSRGDAAKFVGKYQTDLLVYFEICADAPQAIAREKQLKGWPRAKKEALINGFNPEWKPIDLETWEG